MNCKNCEHPINYQENYCSQCGAKIIKNRLTVSYLSNEFMQSFWSLDSNKPLITFLDLFRRPVHVIDGYIHGLRKKYINPYGYFTIALTLTGLYTFINLNYFPEYIGNGAFRANVGEQDISRKLTTKIMENFNFMTFIFVPFITLLSRLVFLKNRKYNLAEHFIIHLYAYSHVHIITSILVIISFINESTYRIMNLISVPVYIIYYSFLFRKLYSLNWWRTLLKTSMFLLLFGTLAIAVSVALIYLYIKIYNPEMA